MTSGLGVRMKKIGKSGVRPVFAEEAMRELKTYRKTRKAMNWTDIKRKLRL